MPADLNDPFTVDNPRIFFGRMGYILTGNIVGEPFHETAIDGTPNCIMTM